MGTKTKVIILLSVLLFGCSCEEKKAITQPSPAITITTWETDLAGPGLKIVYEYHITPYLGNDKYGSPEVVIQDADSAAAYRKQLQRALDELTKIEDAMRRKEGEDAQKKEEQNVQITND